MNRESFTGIVDLDLFREGKGVGRMPQMADWPALFVVCRHVSLGGFGAS